MKSFSGNRRGTATTEFHRYKTKCHQCGNGAPCKVLARIAGTNASGEAKAAPKAKAKARAKANSNTSSGGAKGQRQQLDPAEHKHKPVESRKTVRKLTVR